MYIPDVELHESESLEHAAALLERFGDAARILAGGTDVLVDLKTGRTRTAHLVSINRISALRDVGLERDTDGHITSLRIGTLTTIRQLDASPHVRPRFAALRDATREMASAQVRNLATVGGNIASAVPCADLPPILMVMRASAILWSPAGQREVMLGDFFVGPRRTILKSGELLVGIRVPFPAADSGAAYSRFALREGNAIAVAGVAAALRLTDGGEISDARVALGAVAPTPSLVKAAAAVLCGRSADAEAFELAARAAMRAAAPISDVRGSAEYRRRLVGVLTNRALSRALERARASQEAAQGVVRGKPI